jgi:hypothetical protein
VQVYVRMKKPKLVEGMPLPDAAPATSAADG